MGKELIAETEEEAIKDLKENYLKTGGDQFALVAFEPDVVVGSVKLDKEDMTTHKELTPWMSDLYVRPASRKKGIAYRLVYELLRYAGDNGIQCVYTNTKVPLLEKFFAKFGFVHVAKEMYVGYPTWILV